MKLIVIMYFSAFLKLIKLFRKHLVSLLNFFTINVQCHAIAIKFCRPAECSTTQTHFRVMVV